MGESQRDGCGTGVTELFEGYNYFVVRQFHLLGQMFQHEFIGLVHDVGIHIVRRPISGGDYFLYHRLHFAHPRARKKWWLLPIIVVMFLVGTLLIFAQGSALAPFIYSIF